jgi:hypothetical protein
MATVAHAYLQSNLCQHYRFRDGEEEIMFKLDLNAFMECLYMWMGMHLDKGHTKYVPLRLAYIGSELTIMLEEHDIVTMAKFKTFEVDQPLPSLEFDSYNITSRLIMKVKTEKMEIWKTDG